MGKVGLILLVLIVAVILAIAIARPLVDRGLCSRVRRGIPQTGSQSFLGYGAVL